MHPISHFVTVQPLSKMNVIPTEGRNLLQRELGHLADISLYRFLAPLEMTTDLNCYPILNISLE